MAYEIKQGDTLSQIAIANNTDVNSILKSNPNITDPNKIQAGASLNLPGVTQPPPINTTSDGSALSQGTQALSVPPTKPEAQDFNSIVSGLVSGQQEQIKQAEAQAAPLEQKQTDLSQRIESLLGQSEQRGSDQLALESQANIQGQQQEIQGLTNQLTEISNRTTAQQLAVSEQPILGSIVSGQQARIQRNNAIEALTISSTLAAKQGNLALAQSNINRAIDLKYEPIEQEINNKLKLLSLNRDALSGAEKKVADAQTRKLNLELEQAKDLKDIENQVADFSIQLAKNGAPQSVVDKAMKSGSVLGAVSIGAKYLQSPAEKAQVAYQIAQTSKIYNDMKSSGIVDPTTSLAYAQEYASTGKIPTGLPKGTFGEVAAFAKALPKQQGEIVSTQTGVVPVGASAQIAALGEVYSITELAEQLKELDKERVGGVISGTLGKIFGSDDQQRYIDTRLQIVDLIARARSGAALTAEEEKRYSGMLPGRADEAFFLGVDSQTKIDNFISTVNSDLKNKARAKGWSIYGVTEINVAGEEYIVGDIIQNEKGVTGRINSDGSITVIQ